MASELPDALEKLALKAERSENEQETSLSKYFGQSDNTDDIFDTIAKPSRSGNEEPKVNFFKSPASTPLKEDGRQNPPPTFAFKKGEEESEPKIFSYFSQPPVNNDLNKNADATEFFDQISQLASKTHEPIEISNQGFSTTPQPLPPNMYSQSIAATESSNFPAGPTSEAVSLPPPVASLNLPAIPTNVPQAAVNNVPQVSPRQLFTPQMASPSQISESGKAVETWSQAQERASKWWIPNETVRRWLQSPGSVPPENLKPCYPGLFSATEFTDPIKDLLRHFDGEIAAAERQSLTADMVSQDEQGIRDLIKVGCFRAAANLCGRLLTACGQGYGQIGQPSKHTPHTLQLWLTRLTLLKRSNLVETAFNELAAFGDLDSPDLYFEYYPELNNLKKHGTMVPFSLRLLAAELPAHYNRINDAHAKLCRLLSTVRRILRDVDQFTDGMSDDERKEAVAVWSRREISVIQSLIDCSVMKKDYHNAVQLLKKQLLRHSPTPALHSILGRVYLQIGDVQLAQQSFNAAALLRDPNKASDVVDSFTDAGMVAIAQNAFIEALSYFQQALAIQPDDPVLVNNTAVCLLYVGRMRDGMLLLEENLGTKPDTMIRDETVLNVCTLYELESSLTAQRKLGMLRLASQWRNDNLNVASFKLQIP